MTVLSASEAIITPTANRCCFFNDPECEMPLPPLLLWPLRASSSHYTYLSSRCGGARLLATPQHAQAPIFIVSHPEILSFAPNSYTYTLTHHIISACQLIKRTTKCHCWEQWHKQQPLSYISSPDTLVFYRSLSWFILPPFLYTHNYDVFCSGQWLPIYFHPLYDSFHPCFYLKENLSAIF